LKNNFKNDLILSSTATPPSCNNEDTTNIIENEDNSLFHQTLIDLAQCEAIKEKNNKNNFNEENNKNEENKEKNKINNNDQQFNFIEFFEAPKAFQKMFSHFVGLYFLIKKKFFFNRIYTYVYTL
jgi:hypothetical protein